MNFVGSNSGICENFDPTVGTDYWNYNMNRLNNKNPAAFAV